MSLYFNGLCMIPGHSWHAKMEMEHWARYEAVLSLAGGQTVLDAASGEGYGSDLLSQRAEQVYGVDITECNIVHAKQKYQSNRTNLTFLIADAAKELPMANHSMDLVVSFETIEHLEEQGRFLREIQRVLATDGGAVISTPLPNLDPATGKPRNLHHRHELGPSEFEKLLSSHFPFVAMAGQWGKFPYQLHDDFDDSCDRYLVGLVANSAGTIKEMRNTLPPKRMILIKQELLEIQRAHDARNPVFPRVLLVPMADTDCTNPADFRRIELVRRELRKRGYETAIVPKEEAVDIQGHILLIQNREYSFWNRHAPRLQREGKKLIFTCSDMLTPDTISQVHSFPSYCHKGLPNDNASVKSELAEFIGHCDYVFAGSEAQARHMRSIASGKCPPFWIDNDPVDTGTYQRAEENSTKPGDAFRIVWEGYVDNVPYLTTCAEAIRTLAGEMKVVMAIVTSRERRTAFLGTRDNRNLAEQIFGTKLIEFHEWDPKTIGAVMGSAHVGVAPAFLGDPFSASKPANKAVIINYARLPVVASATEANQDYVKEGVNGFVARDNDEWLSSLRTLAGSPSLRLQMGENGRKMALNYEPEPVVARMVHIIDKLFQESLCHRT